MPIDGLSIIGESINDSVPSTHALFEAGHEAGLLDLARTQDEKGAAYIDINVGARSPGFMADLVRKIQAVTSKPLSIDTPDPAIAAAGLEAYDPAKAGGKPPVLNSITLLRLEMLELARIRPFMPILLVSERVENKVAVPVRDAAETYQAAREVLAAVRAGSQPIPNQRCIIDPGIAPIASDMEGMLKRVLESMRLIHADPDMAGVHLSVGLSNFTVMLPPRRADGSPLKGVLESAFLTKAMPLGLDTIIGSVKRSYALLPHDHPAVRCLDAVLACDGFDAILAVKDFYS